MIVNKAARKRDLFHCHCQWPQPHRRLPSTKEIHKGPFLGLLTTFLAWSKFRPSWSLPRYYSLSLYNILPRQPRKHGSVALEYSAHIHYGAFFCGSLLVQSSTQVIMFRVNKSDATASWFHSACPREIKRRWNELGKRIVKVDLSPFRQTSLSLSCNRCHITNDFRYLLVGRRCTCTYDLAVHLLNVPTKLPGEHSWYFLWTAGMIQLTTNVKITREPCRITPLGIIQITNTYGIPAFFFLKRTGVHSAQQVKLRPGTNPVKV